jgi:hypothetical protein
MTLSPFVSRSRLVALLVAVVAIAPVQAQVQTSHMTFSQKVFTDPRDIALGNAIEASDLARIAELRAQGASFRSVGRKNFTFAQVALHAKQHAPEVMDLVLSGGADPLLAVDGGDPVPVYAVVRDHADPAVVDVLLRHGVSPDWHRTDEDDAYPLMFHAIMGNNEAVVDLLIRRGAKLSYVHPISGSALHMTLDGSLHFDIAARLVDAGIDLSLRDHGLHDSATALERYCLNQRDFPQPLNDETMAAGRRFLAALARRGAKLGCRL